MFSSTFIMSIPFHFLWASFLTLRPTKWVAILSVSTFQTRTQQLDVHIRTQGQTLRPPNAPNILHEAARACMQLIQT
jgi:hypothetical protein